MHVHVCMYSRYLYISMSAPIHTYICANFVIMVCDILLLIILLQKVMIARKTRTDMLQDVSDAFKDPTSDAVHTAACRFKLGLNHHNQQQEFDDVNGRG